MNRSKHLLLLVFLSHCFFFIYAQTSLTNANGEIKTFSYELLVEAPIYASDILGNQLDSTVQIAPKGAKFIKIDTKGANCIIRFLLWKKQPYLMDKLNYTDSSRTELRYFLLSLDEFNEKAIARMSKQPSFSVGAVTIPMRIRSDPFDFSGEFSFGTNLGLKFPLSHYQNIGLVFVGGLQLTHINLDSLDTAGALLESESASALSFTLGAVFEFSQAQVGFYIGWDYIAGPEKDIWIYQGKPWFSIGIGASLFGGSGNGAIGKGGNDSQ